MGPSDPQCAIRFSSQLQPHRGRGAGWSMTWGFRFRAVGLQVLVPFPGFQVTVLVTSTPNSCLVSLTANCPGRVALLSLSPLGSCFPPVPHSQNFAVYHPLDKLYKPSAVSGPHITPKTKKRVKWAQSPPGLARNWQNPPLHLHEACPPSLQGGVGPTLPCPLHVAAGMG